MAAIWPANEINESSSGSEISSSTSSAADKGASICTRGLGYLQKRGRAGDLDAFELLGAFDEVVSLGYREQVVNLVQVRNILEMESHEEKIQEIIAKASQYALVHHRLQVSD